MAVEQASYYVDSLTTSGCAEALTSREIRCNSVFLLPASGNTINLLDPEDNCKSVAIPASGLTVPINNPALIEIQGACGCETLSWVAV